MPEYTEQEANEYMERLAKFMSRRQIEIDFCRDKIEEEYMDEWIGRQFDG